MKLHQTNQRVNSETLALALRAAFGGGDASGVAQSIGDTETVSTLIVPDGVSDQELEQILLEHDPDILTAEQTEQAAAEQARRNVWDIIPDRLAWYYANPLTQDNAGETLARMRAEWVRFLEFLDRHQL